MENKKETITENKVIGIELEESLITTLQRLWLDYKTRESVIHDYLDLHKFDADASCFDSVVFRHYHHLLEEAFYSYDSFSKNVVAEYLPEGIQNYTWEVNFDEKTLNFKIQQ